MSKLIASEVIVAHGRAVGLRRNAVQGEYADYVQRGIAAARKEGYGQLLVEAETGTGKTLGYLVAAGLDCARNNSRAIVATHTVALQRQILRFEQSGRICPECDMSRALTIIKSATGKQLTAGLRLGMRNFLDTDRALRAAERVLGARGVKREVRAQAESFADWARLNPGAQIQSFLEEEGLAALPGGLLFEDVCVTGSSRKSEVSYLKYLEHVAASKRADILVTNHAMLMTNSVRGRNRLLHAEDDDREVCALIIDECDRFEQAARSATSDLVPILPIAQALADLAGSHAGKKIENAQAAVEKLRAMLSDLREHEDDEREEEVQFWDELEPPVRLRVLKQLTAAYEALVPLTDVKKSADEALESIQSYTEALGNVIGRIGKTSADTSSDGVVALRWSPTRHYPSIRTFRLRPARLLKRMWDVWVSGDGEEQEEDPCRAKALVLTSATVGMPSENGRVNFTEMATVYGVYGERNACHALNASGEGQFAPPRFGAVEFVFSHPSAPPVYLSEEEADEGHRELNPQWVQYTVKGILAAHARGGRTLVLTNSYRATEAICDALRKAKGAIKPIEKTASTNQEMCIRAFVSDPNGVFVSPGAWEGFDISQRIGPDGKKLGNAIKHVVVTQVPFAAPDGPFGKALDRHLRRRGYSESQARGLQFNQLFAEAVRKFKQGFGRGIRGAQDSFTLWITDPRFPRSELAGMLRTSGNTQRVETKLRLAIPKRFRVSVDGDSPWDCGSVLMLDGTVLDADTLAEKADAA